MTQPRITGTPILVGDLQVGEDERLPIYVHLIDHPDGRVLVDTGLTELHPAVADMDPRLRPLDQQDFDLAQVDFVVNTHLHFITAGATTSSPAGRSTCSARSSPTPAPSRTTPSRSGWTHPG